MSEPGFLPSAGAAVRQDRLWDKAPAWRGLTMVASLLTLVAVALPILLPDQEVPAPHPALLAPAHLPAALAVKSAQPLIPAPAPQKSEPAPPIPAPPAQHVRLASAPQTLPQAAAPVCNLRQTDIAPRLIGLGTVIGFEDHALSLARIQLTEAAAGGKIDPDYIDNQRVIVRRNNGQMVTFIVPKGMTVQIGDRVTLQAGYRNTALPCNYIPIQIASDFGPAPAPAPQP